MIRGSDFIAYVTKIMSYTPITPFRRPVDAALLAQQQGAQADLPPQGANKWEVLRELGTARTRLGVTDRELVVLQALLSFHPGTVLGGNGPDLIVHPSNASLCTRLNGMPCSTMRRHIAGLVRAGLIARRDSPNGKRYARRYGGEKEAFGFDLSPLPRRFAEICAHAEEIRAEEQRYKRLRQTVSLMRRDLAGLVAYGAEHCPLPLWDRLGDLASLTARELRRKLNLSDLVRLEGVLARALNEARDVLEPDTRIMGIKEAHSEHHYQTSKEDSYASEPCLEKARAADIDPPTAPPVQDDGEANAHLPNIPLGLVLAACAEIMTYAPNGIRHWHDLVRAADIVRPMMGISPTAWDDARAAMGPEEAAVTVAAMLERMPDIQSPGGYLRALTRKAEDGGFSCGPMIMALMRREAA